MSKKLEKFEKVDVFYNADTHELFIDDYDTGEQLAIFIVEGGEE